MNLFAIFLSFALPAAVFVHATRRVGRARVMKNLRLGVLPMANFFIATCWVTKSIHVIFYGGLQPADVSQYLKLGPVLALVMIMAAEFPFLMGNIADWTSLGWARVKGLGRGKKNARK
jgi:hypothetical protein